MQKFLKKPRPVEVIKKALWAGSVCRGKTAMPVNLPKALEVVT